MAQSVNPPNDHYNMAKALSAALEPLIDVCLKLGITSPEMESLLRVAFVQRAFEKLPRHANSGRGPSDSRVGIAAGVHRTEVTRIRTAGGTASARETMETKERLYSKSARVLHGWKTDSRFTTSGGLPLDLPVERNKQRRSFEDLVEKYAPGNHPGTVLKELRRRGNVELLDDEIIRFKSSTTRSKGVTSANVSQAAKRMKRLGETLFQNILEPEQARLYDETGKIDLTAEQLALLRPVIERRAKTFLQALESEFGLRRAPEKGIESKTFGVGVFSWQDD
jgi:Family of unknown function (DUF6502)